MDVDMMYICRNVGTLVPRTSNTSVTLTKKFPKWEFIFRVGLWR